MKSLLLVLVLSLISKATQGEMYIHVQKLQIMKSKIGIIFETFAVISTCWSQQKNEPKLTYMIYTALYLKEQKYKLCIKKSTWLVLFFFYIIIIIINYFLLKCVYRKKVKTTLVVYLQWHGKRIKHICFRHIKEVRISTARNMSYSTWIQISWDG